MLKDFISEAVKSTFFEIPLFDGRLIVRGRILSPAEIERASLSNSLLLQNVLNEKGGISEVQRLQSELTKSEVEDSTIERAYKFLERIRPEQLTKVSENQDIIIRNCITHARRADDGETWERIHFVLQQEQQNADANRLWVGVLSPADRSAILKHALEGHKEAGERLKSFR
jgi:hypothetical protein